MHNNASSESRLPNADSAARGQRMPFLQNAHAESARVSACCWHGFEHINSAMPRTHNQPVAVLPPPAHAEPQEDATNEMDENVDEEVGHSTC